MATTKKFSRTRAAQLRAEGLTYRAIGQALGVSGVAVFTALTGAPASPQDNPPESAWERSVEPGFERFAILGRMRARPPR